MVLTLFFALISNSLITLSLFKKSDLQLYSKRSASIFVLIFNSVGGIFGYGFLGRVNITLVLLLCSGTIIGAIIGPKIVEKTNEEILEIVIPIIIIGINIIFAIQMLL